MMNINIQNKVTFLMGFTYILCQCSCPIFADKWKNNPFEKSSRFETVDTIQAFKKSVMSTSSSHNSPDTTVNIPQLNVTGIWKSGNEFKALINNQIVKKGDIVDLHKVISIKKSSVKVKYKGKAPVVLKLKGGVK